MTKEERVELGRKVKEGLDNGLTIAEITEKLGIDRVKAQSTLGSFVLHEKEKI